MSWRQIGLHSKPLVFLNTDGFYTPLQQWIERAIAENFVIPELFKSGEVGFCSTVDEALKFINVHEPQFENNLGGHLEDVGVADSLIAARTT